MALLQLIIDQQRQLDAFRTWTRPKNYIGTAEAQHASNTKVDERQFPSQASPSPNRIEGIQLAAKESGMGRKGTASASLPKRKVSCAEGLAGRAQAQVRIQRHRHVAMALLYCIRMRIYESDKQADQVDSSSTNAEVPCVS